jgi:hypothetical protein
MNYCSQSFYRYGRITKRIRENLTDRERQQVRRILGWVAASERLLSKRELEAALSIRTDDRRTSKEQRVFLNILRLCGPILEIRDDIIQFVHFTAQR